MDQEKREIASLIDAATERLQLAVKHLGKSLVLFLIGYFTSKWVLEDGNIQSTKENMNTINGLSQKEASFYSDSIIPFLAGIGLVLWKIKSLTNKYYRKSEKSEGRTISEKIFDKITDQISTAFGLQVDEDENVTILGNGWLNDVGNISEIYRSVREEATKAVLNNESWDSFQSRLKIMIEGDDTVTGLMAAHFRTITNDVYSEYYRMISYQQAVQLGYRAAIYEGGLLPEKSRPFCVHRNGKVFTFDEIQLFGTKEDEYEGYRDKSKGLFDGKPRFNYDPFINQGGHNCRHYWSMIPDALAKHLRPELKKLWDGEKD